MSVEAGSKPVLKSRQIGGFALINIAAFVINWKFGYDLTPEDKAIFYEVIIILNAGWGVVSRFITKTPVHLIKSQVHIIKEKDE